MFLVCLSTRAQTYARFLSYNACHHYLPPTPPPVSIASNPSASKQKNGNARKMRFVRPIRFRGQSRQLIRSDPVWPVAGARGILLVILQTFELSILAPSTGHTNPHSQQRVRESQHVPLGDSSRTRVSESTFHAYVRI